MHKLELAVSEARRIFAPRLYESRVRSLPTTERADACNSTLRNDGGEPGGAAVSGKAAGISGRWRSATHFHARR